MKSTKTAIIRDIELNDVALDALNKQKNLYISKR